MSTLWNKGTESTDKVEAFTVSKDREMDMLLSSADVEGSLAHIAMLCSIGLLTPQEYQTLKAALEDIASSISEGSFRLEDDVEDIHSQVELLLTRRLGDLGKKIHAGRSRNDQVLVDLKLFLRAELLRQRSAVLGLFDTLQGLSEKHKDVLMPGYTHGQMAMPSSFGLWFGGYAEALVNDMHMLGGAFRVVNRNPLGSAAGYGNSFPLDREMTTRLLGFDSMDVNSIAAQLSRGKTEFCVASGIAAVALTLGKFASDCCMYLSPNFGFISFPDNLTTGSSIMPHKKNPDVWEMIRAKCNRILACPNEVALLCNSLPHGYHRDFQLLKEILFPALQTMRECLEMADYMLGYISVREDILSDPRYKYIFTVEKVNALVLSGMPFRDAYREVGREVQDGTFSYEGQISHSHCGSIGRLCNDMIAGLMHEAASWGE